mmetsp:Transcript_3620/g.6192  ORF Transcript_3620/g.6192 Transcript_3620/m.6192 type:complete len:102 (-) Transcript_3620:157-462(-)
MSCWRRCYTFASRFAILRWTVESRPPGAMSAGGEANAIVRKCEMTVGSAARATSAVSADRVAIPAGGEANESVVGRAAKSANVLTRYASTFDDEYSKCRSS